MGKSVRRSGYGSDDGFYILRDHLNSSSTIVDQSGVVVTGGNQYYYPFGGNRGSAFSDVTTKRFTGQHHESALPGGEGLSFYNARWYDAQLGRFVSADTIVPGAGNPQAFNRYTYVLNNPIKFQDPSGHAACIDADCTLAQHPVQPSLIRLATPRTVPSWWNPDAQEFFPLYLMVGDYGVFDATHVGRGWRSSDWFTSQTLTTLSRGGGRISDPATSGSFKSFYSVNGMLSEDELEGVLYAMYMDFENQYEAYQGGKLPIEWISGYGPDDFPSDMLGFWAEQNGLHLNHVPLLLEMMGNVTPQRSYVPLTNWVDSSPVGIVRNYEFVPMMPTMFNNGLTTVIQWENTHWPSWMSIPEPVPSGPDTWQRID